MQRCPKCGYKEGRDWPAVLLLLAFGVVSLGAEILGVQKNVRLCIAVGWLLVAASFAWRMVRRQNAG